MLSDTPSSATYLHFLRETGDKAHIHVSTKSATQGDLCFFYSSEIFEYITKLISSDVVRRPQQGGSSVHGICCRKKEEAQTTIQRG